MRLFAAIDISSEVRANLRAFVARLKPFARLSWSPVENLHITTKFIGEWPESRLDEMKQALANVPKPGAIDITIRGIGRFPNERRPRVFWAGVEAPDALRNLAADTEAATEALGVPREERDFSPHLTLARIREPIPLEPLRKALESQPTPSGASHERRFDFGTFRATAFSLYLSAAGRYTKLADFPLIETFLVET
jgi:2'-5' RNA ligase